jgi:hypothetical protein
MDGHGRHLPNVQAIRAHVVDLDNADALANYERAGHSIPPPTFGVHSSPGKRHVYWVVQPYAGNDRFTALQRKLRQVFDGDGAVIDAARVLRVPGTFNMKQPDAPHLVTCEALAGYGQALTVEALEAAYAGIHVTEGGTGERHDLGNPDLAAPSLDWLKYGLSLIDPNDLSRGDWIAVTSAVKQAGWTLTDPETLRAVWEEWCARYDPGTLGSDGKPLRNDPGENHKQWNSLRTTQLGWQSLVNRTPALKAALSFGGAGPSQPLPPMVSNCASTSEKLRAKQYSWAMASTIPPRPWIMGHWLQSGEVTTVIAPGGSGKSTITNAIALAVATGRNIIGQPVYGGPRGAWIYNLEDGEQELERQVAATTLLHSITPDVVGGRLYLNSGMDQPLCVASQTRDGVNIVEPLFDQLAAAIRDAGIGFLCIDPFVSSHSVQENDNGVNRTEDLTPWAK